MTKKQAIDLFCGCGGISVGLRNAGIEILAGVDIEKSFLSSFEHNFPESKALLMDLSKTDPEDFMKMLGIKKGELFLLAGGPPCQGFSKNVPRSMRNENDPKNLLIKTYIQYCKALKPKMVLMENVAEMKSGFDEFYSSIILEELSNLGYKITSVVLNAADFGVPQRRRRAFFLGTLVGDNHFSPLMPTHQKPAEDILNNRHISVWEAISDLPSVKHTDSFNEIDYASDPINNYQKLMRKTSRSKALNHSPRKLQDKQFARLSALEPGQGLKDLPDDLKVKGGYSGAYGRLTKDMVAPTITRWVFHPGSGRWGHPIDTRLISIREAARLQSFPDNFEFVGTYTQQAGQLGNAVPPLLAEKIAKHMIEHYLKESKTVRNSSIDIFFESSGKLKTAL
jgi:DNA (cytosine-5)-methyltransferase 1